MCVQRPYEYRYMFLQYTELLSIYFVSFLYLSSRNRMIRKSLNLSHAVNQHDRTSCPYSIALNYGRRLICIYALIIRERLAAARHTAAAELFILSVVPCRCRSSTGRYVH